MTEAKNGCVNPAKGPLIKSEVQIGKVYGVFDEEAGVDIRGRFLIDPDGVIQAMEVLTPPVGRSVSELVRQVKAFQHVRKPETLRLRAGSLGSPP